MSASDQPRIAVIGCGAWGKNLIRNFAELGALAAIADTDGDRADSLARQHGCRVMTSDEILADPAIQAVVIATPAVLHSELARAALLADKDVFVEKPLSLDVADAEFLHRLAVERRKVLMVGHLLQYHEAFITLKKIVAAGELGSIQYLYSNRLNLGKIRTEENILWSFAPHDISMILSLVGEEPIDIKAVGANYLHRHIADVTTTHLTFSNGVHAHIFVNWLHPFKEQKLVVVGDKGMAVFDDGQPWSSKLILYPQPVHWHDGVPRAAAAKGEPMEIAPKEPLAAECRHFLECIASRATPITDGAEGLRVLKVLQAADRAMSQGNAQSPANGQNTRKFPSELAPNVFVHESAYVDDPCEIGEGTSIWHFSHILGNVRIGKGVSIGQNVVIGPDVIIGDDCKIQNNVSVYKGVTLESGVFCGPSCVFTNVDTPRAQVSRKNEFLPTLVRRGSSIGANATIVCGNTLGEYCLVAAGAVVTKNVAPFALVAGVPARQIGWVSHTGDVLGDDLVCPRTGRRYHLDSAGQLKDLLP